MDYYFEVYKLHILKDMEVDNKCINCGKIGHFYHKCPLILAEEQIQKCNRCKLPGHTYKNCKETIRERRTNQCCV